MTRDDITRMAREAGLVMYDYSDPSLERFANIVAETEREACAKRLDAIGCDHCATNIRLRGKE
jgi:hypothetical protein